MGLLFLFAPGSYALACPLWGHLGDKKVGCSKSQNISDLAPHIHGISFIGYNFHTYRNNWVYEMTSQVGIP